MTAARELVMLTARPSRPRLVLHYPPPGLLKVLQLGWPEARPRIAVGTARPDGTGVRGRRALSLVPTMPADGPAPA